MSNPGSNHGRVRARRCAVQALYQWLISGTHPDSIVKEFVADRELVKVDMDYFAELTRGVPKCFDDLLSDIEAAIDRDWSRLDTVEKSVLLIGAYELRYSLHVPYRVVVNEGIELCKMFGAEDAHRYVNGVLDKIARVHRHVEISSEAALKT